MVTAARSRLRSTFATASLLLFLLTGCGSGGGSGSASSPSGQPPAPVGVTLAFHSDSAKDGYIRNQNGSFLVNTNSIGIAAGEEDGFDYVYRGFYHFDHALIPPGSTVISATLRLYQANVWGDPYTTLGPLLVDHLNIQGGLSSTYYDSVPLEAAVGAISSDATLGIKTLDVTAQVLADRAANRTTTGFRVRFALDSDSDNQSDSVQLTDGPGNPGGPRAALDIEFAD